MPPTQRNLGFSQLRVGIFVLIGLVVFGFLVLNATGEWPFGPQDLFGTQARQNLSVELHRANCGGDCNGNREASRIFYIF